MAIYADGFLGRYVYLLKSIKNFPEGEYLTYVIPFYPGIKIKILWLIVNYYSFLPSFEMND